MRSKCYKIYFLSFHNQVYRMNNICGIFECMTLHHSIERGMPLLQNRTCMIFRCRILPLVRELGENKDVSIRVISKPHYIQRILFKINSSSQSVFSLILII